MYENLLMVKDGIASRTPVPVYFDGMPESILKDLSWSDPALGYTDSVWWPGVFVDGSLGRDFKWGEESYHLDYENQIVEITREQVPLTQEEKDERRARELMLMSPLVDEERDRRIASGFTFDGVSYQTQTSSDRENILGALGVALAAITVDEAQPGDLRWANPQFDFFWIASDDTRVPMDAQTCLAFARAAVSRKSLLVIAGNSIKQMDPIPDDYADDKYWPDADATAKAKA